MQVLATDSRNLSSIQNGVPEIEEARQATDRRELLNISDMYISVLCSVFKLNRKTPALTLVLWFWLDGVKIS